MGFIDKFKNATGQGKKKEENIDKKALKGVAKAGAAMFAVIKAIIMLILTLWKFILIAMVVAFVIVCFDFIIEMVTGESTPSQIYALAEVEDVKELVEIKENDDGEYYLDWVEDIDEKLEEIVEYMNNNPGVHNLPKSTDFLKKIIKAEIITQYPDLGGEVPEGSDGFQGAVDIKRVSPNKEIGAVENKGAGETYSLESDLDDGEVQEGDYEEVVKAWQKGKKLETRTTTTVYKQTESELNPGNDTGDWQPVYNEKTSSNLKIEEGEEVEYLGTYKNNTNALTETVTTYVEIKHGETQGFVKAQYLIDPDEETKTSSNEDESNITKVATTATSRAKDDKKTIANENEEYTIAIAAGHNNSNNQGASNKDLKEEEMTIKVAEKVEKLFEDYSNVKVVQTGSTSDNPGGVQLSERTKLAREANPNLCIQIHFNSGGGTGVEVIYKDNDGISQQLAEILSESISNSMSLKNRGAKTETAINKHLSIIENAATSNFPSVVTEGGFLDGDYDYLKTDEAIENYAKGIVEGVKKYLESDHSGYTSTETISQTATESIESKIRNMKYVKPETMDSYLKSEDDDEKKKALNVFTIDEEGNILTATWSYNDGTIKIQKNSRTINLATSLQKYTVPFEYLLYFYIDTNEKDFSEALADEILKSEIVLALEDNVNTVKTTTTVQEKQVEDGETTKDWSDKEGGTTEVVTESCTTSINFTYIDCWFVKAYRDNSYSEEVLKMDDNDEIVVNVMGSVVENESKDLSSEVLAESGTKPSGEKDEDGNEIMIKWKRYERTKTDTKTIRHQYSKGDLVTEGKEEIFAKLYKEHDMKNLVREYYLFNILENNDKTKNELLELTKYLIYKATNINYGTIEFDFSNYSLDAFTNIDGYYGDWDGTGSQEDFINAVAPYAVMDMEKYQIYASVTIAQAIIESGWGKDNIAIQYKNFFGMKVGGGTPNEYWSGNSVNLNASEGGTSYFRVYDSLGNSIHDHGRNFIVTSTYAAHGVLDCIPQNLGPKEQLKRIAQSGYAVDRNGNITKPDGKRTYDQYLYEEFIQKYNLERFDTMSSSDFQISGNNKIIEIARTKLGCAYSWGATGPNTFDCSGFVMWVYQQNGISVPRSTSGYKPYLGTDKEISWDEAQPGDIVWRDGHMGIYLGDDKYIHAPQTGDVVKESSGAKKSFTNVFRFY